MSRRAANATRSPPTPSCSAHDRPRPATTPAPPGTRHACRPTATSPAVSATSTHTNSLNSTPASAPSSTTRRPSTPASSHVLVKSWTPAEAVMMAGPSRRETAVQEPAARNNSWCSDSSEQPKPTTTGDAHPPTPLAVRRQIALAGRSQATPPCPPGRPDGPLLSVVGGGGRPPRIPPSGGAPGGVAGRRRLPGVPGVA